MTGFLGARYAIKGAWAALVAIAFALLLIALAVQTTRLEGLHVWPISFAGWIKTAETRQLKIDAILAAQDQAKKDARAARVAQETVYRDIAERIDDNAQDSLEGAMRAADRFIAACGLRAEATGNLRCGPGTGAGNRGAADPDGTRRAAQLDAEGIGGAAGLANGFVVVRAEDVRICTTNTVKAEAGRKFAIDVEAASKAEVPPVLP